jgi:hypothetical protein
VKQHCSPRFVAERARYALRFTCEHCSHYQAEQQRCTHGYPTEAHRSERYEAVEARGSAGEQNTGAESELVFCKDFDLW